MDLQEVCIDTDCCSICLQYCSCNQKELKCLHRFHNACLAKYILFVHKNNTNYFGYMPKVFCPMCRTTLKRDDILECMKRYKKQMYAEYNESRKDFKKKFGKSNSTCLGLFYQALIYVSLDNTEYNKAVQQISEQKTVLEQIDSIIFVNK